MPSSIVEASSGFHQVSVRLREGDAILLFTDGIEESGRSFRDRNLAEIVCDEAPGYREGQEIYHDERMTHKVGTNSEELGLGRIHDIVNAVMGRKNYRLSKYHAEAEGDLEFDFSTCKGSLDEAILALTAVERVFRVYPDPSATPSDRIMVDRKIDAFLEQHFKEYPRYFPSKIDHETRGEYVYYPGVMEDPQDDDLTILGIRKT